jgi:hypothetical protein
MKIDQLTTIIKNVNEHGLELIQTKSHDYAGEDVFKNFKQMEPLLAILEVDMAKPEGIHMFYILLKIQRLCNLIFSEKQGKNESIQDTLIDLRNYTDLLNARIYELTKEKENAAANKS